MKNYKEMAQLILASTLVTTALPVASENLIFLDQTGSYLASAGCGADVAEVDELSSSKSRKEIVKRPVNDKKQTVTTKRVEKEKKVHVDEDEDEDSDD